PTGASERRAMRTSRSQSAAIASRRATTSLVTCGRSATAHARLRALRMIDQRASVGSRTSAGSCVVSLLIVSPSCWSFDRRPAGGGQRVEALGFAPRIERSVAVEYDAHRHYRNLDRLLPHPVATLLKRRLRQLADLLDEGKGHHIVARELLASAPQLGEDLRSERLRLPLAARGAEGGADRGQKVRDLSVGQCDPLAV